MSSTNKTTYYNLSQYIGTDKPTYLGDYNSDMTKIDAGIHDADDKATTATQNAGSAIARVGELEKTVKEHTTGIGTLQTDVTSLKENVKTAQDTANTANTKADSAQTSANNAIVTANNASSKADKINNDITLWTGSIKSGVISLNQSLSGIRFLYVETSLAGITALIPYRTDKRLYNTAQIITSPTSGTTQETIGVKINVEDDTHINIHAGVMDHAFGAGHTGFDTTAIVGVYGIPK